MEFKPGDKLEERRKRDAEKHAGEDAERHPDRQEPFE